MMDYVFSYTTLREELGKELLSASQSFVRIGYMLRLAQETDILKNSPYENVHEFAASEFGLEQSQVSRFIAINKRFSVGGFSDQLIDSFARFGVSKLSVMLTLPDSIVEEISPDYSKAEIEEVAREVKEAAEGSDIEVMMEDPHAHDGDRLYQAVKSLLHMMPDMFKKCIGKDQKQLKDIICPLGEAIYFTRVPGLGKISVSIRSDVAIEVIRTEEKEKRSWKEFADAVQNTVSQPWEAVYGEPCPIKEEPEEKKAEPEITVPRPDETKKTEQKQEDKRQQAKPQKKIEKPKHVVPERKIHKPVPKPDQKPDPKPDTKPDKIPEPDKEAEADVPEINSPEEKNAPVHKYEKNALLEEVRRYARDMMTAAEDGDMSELEAAYRLMQVTMTQLLAF